jgi:hypothetical protein
MAVALSSSPCVFGIYYNSPYPYPFPLEAVGLASLVAFVTLGLVAATLARGPRLGPAAVGLLAGAAPGFYLGLKAVALVPPDAATAAMAIGVLASVVIGGAAGLSVGIMAQREGRRTPWLGPASLGLALGTSTGLYLTSILAAPMVAHAGLIYPLAGGAIGLALGLETARGGRSRPWLGRASLGVAVGCSTGIWAFQVVYNLHGLFHQWAVWTVWPALGGAAGLAWAGRSGVGRLQPAAAGLAVGACAGAGFAASACLSTACSQGSSALRTWGLVGSLAGAALGLAVGAFGYRTRLSWAALGLAIGAFLGDTAFTFHTGAYEGSLDASELVASAIVGVFGLLVGWLAADAEKRPAAFGLAFGGWIGGWTGVQAVSYDILPGGADRGGILGMLVGGLIGLAISQRTDRLHFGSTTLSSTTLSVAVGAFVAARFCDPGSQSALRGIAGVIIGMIIGGYLGLILCWRGERALIACVPRLAVGTAIGTWVGTAVLAEFPVPAPPTATSLICMTAGGLVGLMYGHGSQFIMAGRLLASTGPIPRPISLPWQDARLDRLTRLSRWLASLAAVVASGDPTLQDRYAEEFDSTLSMITGPLAPLRRLRCAMSILIGILTLRMENEEDDEDDEDDA